MPDPQAVIEDALRKEGEVKAAAKTVDPVPDPPLPKPVTLTPIQVATLDMHLWKQRALIMQYREAQELLEQRRVKMNEASSERNGYAAGCGIDVTMDFDWDDDGKVSYHAPKKQVRPKSS